MISVFAAEENRPQAESKLAAMGSSSAKKKAPISRSLFCATSAEF